MKYEKKTVHKGSLVTKPLMMHRDILVTKPLMMHRGSLVTKPSITQIDAYTCSHEKKWNQTQYYRSDRRKVVFIRGKGKIGRNMHVTGDKFFARRRELKK